MSLHPPSKDSPLVLDRLDVNIALLLVARSEAILANLVGVHNGNLGLVAVEDLGNLLESGTLGLDVEENDEDEFEEDPDLIMISNCMRKERVTVLLTA